MENGNAQGSWSGRVIWLDATVQQTNPLRIKMVYYDQLADQQSEKGEFGADLVSDSTIVQYNWDENSKTLQGQYHRSKISKAQVLSYYLDNSDILYINTHYEVLKAALHHKTQRTLLLSYLNKIKNYYGKR